MIDSMSRLLTPHERVTATNARIHFGELMRKVIEHREPIVVERARKPQVVIMALEQYESLLANQKDEPDWRIALKETHALVREELKGHELIPTPADIIHQAREERYAKFADLC